MVPFPHCNITAVAAARDVVAVAVVDAINNFSFVSVMRIDRNFDMQPGPPPKVHREVARVGISQDCTLGHYLRGDRSSASTDGVVRLDLSSDGSVLVVACPAALDGRGIVQVFDISSDDDEKSLASPPLLLNMSGNTSYDRLGTVVSGLSHVVGSRRAGVYLAAVGVPGSGSAVLIKANLPHNYTRIINDTNATTSHSVTALTGVGNCREAGRVSLRSHVRLSAQQPQSTTRRMSVALTSEAVLMSFPDTNPKQDGVAGATTGRRGVVSVTTFCPPNYYKERVDPLEEDFGGLPFRCTPCWKQNLPMAFVESSEQQRQRVAEDYVSGGGDSRTCTYCPEGLRCMNEAETLYAPC